MKKRICFLIPDGVGIRNYLYSDVIKYIREAGHEVVIWHALPDEVISLAEELHGISIEAHRFESFPDPYLIRLQREASTYARLKLNSKIKNNPTILTNWDKKRNSIGKKLLYPLAEMLGSVLKSYTAIESLERAAYRLQQRTEVYENLRNKLKTMKVDVLFCTHQRVPQIVSAILAAQSLDIKTATAIFSWDNLPKARLPFRVDRYLVWSNYMKKELLEYYPDIPENAIANTGTPQFDFYRDKSNFHTKEEFADKYNLNPNSKWVLFSGDDQRTSPYDADYLRDIAEALRDEKDIEILFRQVPVEDVDRYVDVLGSCLNITHIPPLWNKGSHWSSFTPTYEDVKLLANLAKHCSTVINVGSTMALDFAFFDHPALYINYDQPHSEGWSVETIYRFEHFKTMNDLNAVGWINAKSEIKEMVRMAVDRPNEVGIDRLKWKERITGASSNQSASQKIVNVLLKTI